MSSCRATESECFGQRLLTHLTTCPRALAKKNAANLAASEPQLAASSSGKTATSGSKSRVPPKAPKKDVKSLMKGVVLKKARAGGTPSKTGSSSSTSKPDEGKSGVKRTANEGEQSEKKRKL